MDARFARSAAVSSTLPTTWGSHVGPRSSRNFRLTSRRTARARPASSPDAWGREYLCRDHGRGRICEAHAPARTRDLDEPGIAADRGCTRCRLTVRADSDTAMAQPSNRVRMRCLSWGLVGVGCGERVPVPVRGSRGADWPPGRRGRTECSCFGFGTSSSHSSKAPAARGCVDPALPPRYACRERRRGRCP
jgi:hypothetical protein